jgi:hypothetical protein
MKKDQKAAVGAVIIVALALIYMWLKTFVAQHPYWSIAIVVLIVAGVILLIYYTIKSPELKEKQITFFQHLFGFLKNIFSAMGEGSKEGKKRVPISAEKQKKVFDRADNQCQHCGKKNVKLNIHHINGNPADNNMDNLIALCPNDHSIAESLPVNVLRNQAQKPYHIITTHKKDTSQ